jgi:hypothetical protein
MKQLDDSNPVMDMVLVLRSYNSDATTPIEAPHGTVKTVQMLITRLCDRGSIGACLFEQDQAHRVF